MTEMLIHAYRSLILTGALMSVGQTGVADEKTTAIAGGESKTKTESVGKIFTRPTSLGKASRTMLTEDDVKVPLVVVRGTPYEMGHQLGVALQDEIRTFIPAALKGISSELGVIIEDLQDVWARTAAYADDRVEQEMLGMADGSGVPLATLQAVHAVPLLMPYSCSSIAAWGDAT